MSEEFSVCPKCEQQAVRTKTVYFRELKVDAKAVVETETVIEQECMQCGWIASVPVSVN